MTNSETEIPAIDWGRTDLLIELALSEDLDTTGDVTTNSVVPENATAEAVLLCKEPGMVLAGLPVAERVFKLVEPRLEFKAIREDGDHCEYGDVLAEIHGPARGLLNRGTDRAELSATPERRRPPLRRSMPPRWRGRRRSCSTPARPLPATATSKKYAVAVGGATNHRIGLYDRVMIKDNHREMAAMEGPAELSVRWSVPGRLIRSWRSKWRPTPSTRCVRRSRRVRITSCSTTCPTEMMAEAVKLVNGRAKLEASGGITLERLPRIGKIGVDFVSAGALTHSVKAADISLDIRVSK